MGAGWRWGESVLLLRCGGRSLVVSGHWCSLFGKLWIVIAWLDGTLYVVEKTWHAASQRGLEYCPMLDNARPNVFLMISDLSYLFGRQVIRI